MELTVSDADVKHNPRACALAAYQLSLRPYHGMLMAGIFRAALAFAPSERSVLIKNFGWTDDGTATNDVIECVEAMRPVTHRVMKFLDDEGLNFPDKVGSPLQQHTSKQLQ